jgi:CubicO group peptidase (beta-lactamase class C family)
MAAAYSCGMQHVEGPMAYSLRNTAAAVAVTLLAAALAGCDAAPTPNDAPDPTVAAAGPAMDAYLSDLSGGRQFRGAVLVARGTDVLLSKGYDLADQAAGIANTPHTLFRIGSVTKQFTALAVLKLQELGKLNVTDRVCQHVTPCPAAWKTVTVEQLLVHTSGIPNYTGFPEYPSVLMTTLSPEQLVGLFRDRPTDFPPGSRWQYSNSGYSLLGYLIERLTGVSYAEFLHRQILDPLGMTDTGYDVNHPTGEAHAIGYAGWDNTPAAFVDMSIPYAAGAIYSNVSDLYKWNRFLLTRTPAVVQAATLADMFTPRVPIDRAAPDKRQYGYGWDVAGPSSDVTYSHGGNIDGFAAFNLIRPRDQLSITVLSNLESADSDVIARNLATIASR